MKVALQSDAVVGLHIRNDSLHGCVSIEVPVRYLVRTRNVGAALTNAALISNVRHSATTALLESRPGQPAPADSFKYFELSSYQSKDGTYLSTSDNTLSQILEAAVTINIHDGDEGVVLHIFCGFVRKYHSSYSRGATRNIRASAAAASGRERERLAINLKSWAVNKHQSIAFNPASARKYMLLPEGERLHPMQRIQQWRDQAVNLIVPEDQDEKEFIREKTDAVIKCAETTLDFLVEGAVRSSETVVQLVTTYNFQPFPDSYAVPQTEFGLDEEMREKEEGVEIILDSDDNTTPSEWKIIFEVDDSEFDSVSSMAKQDDGVIIDLLDDVQSLSSDESIAQRKNSEGDLSYDMMKRLASDGDISYDSEQLSFADISIDDDDTSWALLDEDTDF